ncbi:hypothetical protein LR013_02265 [candidate division NPL-UPA2 bacterium]|nr:hypothetical protein [candidate division NPL-UPA2 bacterium]
MKSKEKTYLFPPEVNKIKGTVRGNAWIGKFVNLSIGSATKEKRDNYDPAKIVLTFFILILLLGY